MAHNRYSNKYCWINFWREDLSSLLVSVGWEKGRNSLKRESGTENYDLNPLSRCIVSFSIQLLPASSLISNLAYQHIPFFSQDNLLTLYWLCNISSLWLSVPSAWITFSTPSPITFLTVTSFVFSTNAHPFLSPPMYLC